MAITHRMPTDPTTADPSPKTVFTHMDTKKRWQAPAPADSMALYPLHLLVVASLQTFVLIQLALDYLWLRLSLKRPPEKVLEAQRRYLAAESRHSSQIHTITVIVPVLNENGHDLARCLSSLAAGAAHLNRVEVIVVDAGSTDGTMVTVEAIDASLSAAHEAWFLRVSTSACGRGPAINKGIVEADGDVLLMLHADTLLPANWDEEVIHALINPAVLCSAFRFAYARESLDGAGMPRPDAFTPRPVGLALLEWSANWRSRWCELPLGEQAIALRARTLASIGGMNQQPLFEDFELVNTLRRAAMAGGGRLAILGGSVRCMPRCPRGRGGGGCLGLSGAWRTSWRKHAALLRYRWGVPLEALFEVYYGFGLPSSRLSAKEVLKADVARVSAMIRKHSPKNRALAGFGGGGGADARPVPLKAEPVAEPRAEAEPAAEPAAAPVAGPGSEAEWAAVGTDVARPARVPSATARTLCQRPKPPPLHADEAEPSPSDAAVSDAAAIDAARRIEQLEAELSALRAQAAPHAAPQATAAPLHAEPDAVARAKSTGALRAGVAVCSASPPAPRRPGTPGGGTTPHGLSPAMARRDVPPPGPSPAVSRDASTESFRRLSRPSSSEGPLACVPSDASVYASARSTPLAMTPEVRRRAEPVTEEATHGQMGADGDCTARPGFVFEPHPTQPPPLPRHRSGHLATPVAPREQAPAGTRPTTADSHAFLDAVRRKPTGLGSPSPSHSPPMATRSSKSTSPFPLSPPRTPTRSPALLRGP